MPIVRAIPRCESGRVFLKLTNDFDKIVRVKAMHQTSSGAGAAFSRWPLSNMELDPNRAQELDMTDELRPMFNLNSPERQERTIKIGLSLDPIPPHQRGPGKYRVVFEKGQFVEFVESVIE